MLQLKDLRKRGVGERVTDWDGKILVELEGPLGGRVPVRKPGCKRRTLFAGHGEIVPT